MLKARKGNMYIINYNFTGLKLSQIEKTCLKMRKYLEVYFE